MIVVAQRNRYATILHFKKADWNIAIEKKKKRAAKVRLDVVFMVFGVAFGRSLRLVVCFRCLKSKGSECLQRRLSKGKARRE